MHADRALKSTHIRFRDGSGPYQKRQWGGGRAPSTPLPPPTVSLITNNLAENTFSALRKQRSYERQVAEKHPVCLRFGAAFES
jgi:hypothetical protein